MDTAPRPLLLIPGAWMGGWIWEDTIERLSGRGVTAHTLTLPGLAGDRSVLDMASVALDDHVTAALAALRSLGEPAVVVGHSYSGIVAGMVADRAPEVVARTVIVAGFFPRDGRSLLDDWGDGDDDRAAERDELEQAGMRWAPPPAEGVAADVGLTDEQAAWLSERLRPHPGRTIIDGATMRRPITEQRVTVIADVGSGDPRSTLPDDLAAADLDRWTFRAVPEGHWPMLGCADDLDDLLVEAAGCRD